MTAPGPGPRPLWVALTVLAAVSTIAYPMAIYIGLTRWSLRGTALVLLALMVPVAARRLLRGGRPRWGQMATMALVPVVAAALFAISAALDSADAALLVPVAIHTLLLSAFGPTLWSARPMIERFARMQHDDLRPEEVRWCRLWTGIWCGFFALNIVGNLALVAWAPLGWWTVYNGLVAYVLMGLLFAVEWIVRKRRFGRIGDTPLERLLRRLWPAVDRGHVPSSGSEV